MRVASVESVENQSRPALELGPPGSLRSPRPRRRRDARLAGGDPAEGVKARGRRRPDDDRRTGESRMFDAEAAAQFTTRSRRRSALNAHAFAIDDKTPLAESAHGIG